MQKSPEQENLNKGLEYPTEEEAGFDGLMKGENTENEKEQEPSVKDKVEAYDFISNILANTVRYPNLIAETFSTAIFGGRNAYHRPEFNQALFCIIFGIQDRKKLQDFIEMFEKLQNKVIDKNKQFDAWLKIRKKEDRDEFDKKNIEDKEQEEQIIDDYSNIIRKFINDLKIRVFEIGGDNFCFNKLENYLSYDASGYSEMTGADKLSGTMNDRNYKEILDKIDSDDPEHLFDVTTSKFTFDYGSGIEQTVTPHNHIKGASEVLKVLNLITKKGGYSIHQLTGGNESLLWSDNDNELLAELGFEIVYIYHDETQKQIYATNYPDAKYTNVLDTHPIIILKKV